MEPTPSYDLKDLGNDFYMNDTSKDGQLPAKVYKVSRLQEAAFILKNVITDFTVVKDTTSGRTPVPQSLVNAAAGAAFLANTMAVPALAATPRTPSDRDQRSALRAPAKLPATSELSAPQSREVAILPIALPLLIWAYGEFFRPEEKTHLVLDGQVRYYFMAPEGSEAQGLIGNQPFSFDVPNGKTVKTFSESLRTDGRSYMEMLLPQKPAYLKPKKILVQFNQGEPQEIKYEDLKQDSQGRKIITVPLIATNFENGKAVAWSVSIDWEQKSGWGSNEEPQNTSMGGILDVNSTVNFAAQMRVEEALRDGRALDVMTPVVRERLDDRSGQEHEFRKNSTSIVKLTNTGSRPTRVKVTDGVVDSPVAIIVTVPANATEAVKVQEGSIVAIEDANFDSGAGSTVDMTVLHLKPQGESLLQAIVRDSANKITNQFSIQKDQTFEWQIRESVRAMPVQSRVDDELRLQGMLADAGHADVPTLPVHSPEGLNDKDFLPYGVGEGWGGDPHLGPINGPGQPKTSVDLGRVSQKVQERLKQEPDFLEKMVSTIFDTDVIYINDITAIAKATKSTPHEVRAKLANDLLVQIKEKNGRKGVLPKGTKLVRLTAGHGSSHNRVLAHNFPAIAYNLPIGGYTVTVIVEGLCGNFTGAIKPPKQPVVVTPPAPAPETSVTATPPQAKPKMPMVGEVAAKDTQRTIVSRPAMSIPVFPATTKIDINNGNTIDVAGSTATAEANAAANAAASAAQQQQQLLINSNLIDIINNNFNNNQNFNTTNLHGFEFKKLDHLVSMKDASALLFDDSLKVHESWELRQSVGISNRDIASLLYDRYRAAQTEHEVA